jgi:hypothetical protein
MPKRTYPNLTACCSGPEARICIFLIPFQIEHFEVGGNVKLMKENIRSGKQQYKRKKHGLPHQL